MKVLILGSGGREHALAWKTAQSPKLTKLYCAPGSDAIAELAQCVALDILDPKAVAAFCLKEGIDLVLIGPESALEAGVADALTEAGIKTFGPGRAAARLESSKVYAKQFLARHEIPTARFEAFTDSQMARSAAEARRLPLVVKADGLAAGKGVRVCKTTNEALGAVSQFMERKTLGKAGETIILEECLEGPEVSIMVLCDGKNYRLLPPCRDHKRLKDHDEGPNTGGMGAYAPAALDEKTLAIIKTRILDRTLAGLAADGLDYRGVLYAGIMLTPEGPKVLEFNCRFGDPETQAVLPLIKSDLIDLALACIEQKLERVEVELTGQSCVCVTLASEGYPSHAVTGRAIEGISSSPLIFHAGTQKINDRWLTAGGRVLGVAAVGKDLPSACEKAYAAVSKIRFEAMQYRKDIANRSLAELQ